MSEIVKILMERDGMSEKEAQEELMWAQQKVHEGEDPEEVLYELELEPDYVFEIL